MSDGTKIAWTDATWNPIRARRRDGQPNKAGGGWICQRVSAGCQNCYAAGINKRLGTGFDYDAKGIAASDIYLDEKALEQPLHWKKPRRIFVCSMTDLFGEWVPDEMIDRVFAVMALSKSHTFQLLTKRPERMREYLNGLGADTPEFSTRWDVARRWLRSVLSSPQDRKTMGRWEYVGVMMAYQRFPLPNVWLGVSVENQRVADERIPELLATPAAVRFVSAEPLLGPVDLATHKALDQDGSFTGWRIPYGLHWVIVGGESGPGARPCNIDWIRGIVQQCQGARVPVFVKQLGAKPLCVDRELWERDGRSWETIEPTGARVPMKMRDPKGGDLAEWPASLRARQYPEVGR